ncbi:ATP-binding protein [Chryseolinea sp. H1M3-3]|uniref:sensor histidine kinase n=1 Tax=Chryseolinea sp. H1M3-3 TaxID=3034144 RepID=UPI0023EBEDAF|nr:ATP-binding protein [Chryseolinea sp. H1M3-3]
MKVYFDRKVLVGFFLALGILAVLGVYSYRNSRESIATSQMVARTNEALYHIERLHSAHLQLEAEVMRYTIEVDTFFISFYHDRLNDARIHFQKLMEMMKDDPAQRARLDSIRVLGKKKIDLINQVIQARQLSIDSVGKLIPSAFNKSLLAKINETIEAMQAAEKKLLDQHILQRKAEISKFYSTFITLLLATALIMIVLFLTINSTLRARLQAEHALQIASKEINDLYHNAPCGYHSVDGNGLIVQMNSTWFDWIGYNKDEVINKMTLMDLLTPASKQLYTKNFEGLKTQGFLTNVELEISRKNGTILFIILNATAIKDEHGNFLKSRSTAFDITDRHLAEEKVIAANKELEAFTYSVSHDLRTPLRSIDGYSKILQEDYSSKIDAEANRLLNIIRNNARRMGELIDDLLNFSRTGRKEIEKSAVNMNVLVANIQQELLVPEKSRNIKFTVQPLKDIDADNSMMRQVWVNLISNALKYSRKQAEAVIEIGCKPEEGRILYYIRDNGVGFDMKYADKLFGVFQRLHKIDEFEGTGVGLALVHRIISRHGGKIWAEAHVNKGATFFFFIPTKHE